MHRCVGSLLCDDEVLAHEFGEEVVDFVGMVESADLEEFLTAKLEG